MVVIEVGDPLLQLVAAGALLHAEVEQVYVGVQGELVHGVDAAHVVQHEEQDGGAQRTRTVALRGQTEGGRRVTQMSLASCYDCLSHVLAK